MTLLSATQAAHRMGVKVQTVYAYASRGVLRRQTGADGRTSWFDERDVDALVRRGRPRRSSRDTSLDLLIETRLTAISTTGVAYRGHASAHLARTVPFESVAELLWLGELRPLTEPWAGRRVDVDRSVGVAHAIRLIVAESVPPSSRRTEYSPTDVATIGRELIATVVDSLRRTPDGPVGRLTVPDGSGPFPRTVAGRLWAALSDRRPPPGMLGVINAVLVLMADHELAASTLAARVAASARAHPAAAALAGLGTLQGFLHGGATRLARELLDDALEVGAAKAVTRAHEEQRRIPGFGHRVYPGIDPRAEVLLHLLGSVNGGRRVLTIADEVRREVATRIGRAPNVDFGLAVATRVAGLGPDAGEALMAVARIAGWLAHASEEYAEAPLRFRPRASYIGA